MEEEGKSMNKEKLIGKKDVLVQRLKTLGQQNAQIEQQRNILLTEMVKAQGQIEMIDQILNEFQEESAQESEG